jgi:hypothetical protein
MFGTVAEGETRKVLGTRMSHLSEIVATKELVGNKKIKERELLEEVLQPRSVAVNHAGLWILRRQFESARGYFLFHSRHSFSSGESGNNGF